MSPHTDAGALLLRLEIAQKDCFDQGHLAAAILFQDARAEIVRQAASQGRAGGEVGQLYVVDVEDRKSGKVSAVYVFDNHAAALKCRRDLNMDHDHLRGCCVFSEWSEGQPQRALSPPVKTGGGERFEVRSATQISELDDASNACLELASKHGYATGHGDTVADMIREFSVQIPAVAQAALAWSPTSKPNENCHYDHTSAATPFGTYQIEWKSWKDYPQYSVEFAGNFVTVESQLDDAKEAALADFNKRMRASSVPIGSPRGRGMRVQENQGEFDPGDPYDAMCESFRIQVADLASNAYRATIYRDMPPERQLSSFMAGVLTGLIGVCFVSIRDEGREVMMQGIVDALPFARQQAEDIIKDALTVPSAQSKPPVNIGAYIDDNTEDQ